ncbi:AAA family ATPase [Noviherbaspirillum galbum]|uniref:AAA family ATPase n=1 Tax=Noviherbaspirillum galbum TaxID=2709383 RepID=A0A6B3SRQ1_9BURK|nr:AAA family ATPase [Noviherbaspirillum galbum]NEX63423.1 AAA family ATPase [Noviherbaspirillum galbum]
MSATSADAITPAVNQVSGVLTSVQIYNGRWGRGYVRLDDDAYLTVTGEALNGLSEGNRYRFDGKVVVHAKFGTQFECRAAVIEIPLSEDALVRHLKKNFKGVGEATAKKLVASYGGNLAALRDTLVSNPYSLDFSAVTRRKVAVQGGEDLKGLIYRDLSTRIGITGVKDSILRKLAEWLVPQVEEAADPVAAAWAQFSADPYQAIQYLDGYGFAAADQIALRSIGFPRFHEFRMAALATHALREGCEQNGHTFLTLDNVFERISAVDTDVSPEKAMAAAEARSEPIIVEEGRYYPRHLWHAEKALAANLATRALQMGEPIVRMAEDRLFHEIAMAEKMLSQPEKPFKLDESQHRAVVGILTSTHRVHTLTAGPGCGKTALMEILVHVVRDKKILFCAPTGKAAKVLSSRVKRFNLSASTIHLMLGVTVEGFQYNEENPLDADIIIADESSMDDLMLARALMDAVPYNAHIIFLGDTDQLPSVGPGQVLANLLQMPLNHHRLSVTHRNDGGILDVVRQAGSGWVDCVNRPDVTFSHGLPAPDDVGITRVVNAYVNAINRCGISRVGLLMPRRKGDIHTPGWNTTYLNELLRVKLNPDGARVVGTTLRLGDRIIIRKNLLLEQGEDKDGKKVVEQVVNGDTGFIRECHVDQTGTSVAHLYLELDDGRSIKFPGKELEAIGLAYAMTVHAAQGSEYDVVIFVCTNGSPTFVHRGIVYTAFSRAKVKLLVLGEDNVIRQIVKRDIPQRNSMLVERMRAAMRRIQKAGGVA